MNEVQVYTAKRGDTFWGIAEYFYGDGSKYPIIQEYNNNYNLRAGDTIYIPPLQQQRQQQAPRNNAPRRQFNANDQRVQIMLNALGYNTKGMDGIIGQNTQNAIYQFQADYGIYQSGQADQDTVNTLWEAFKENPIYTSGTIFQLMLHYAGFSPGTIDGVVGRNTKNALRQFQAYVGLYQSGEFDDDSIYNLKLYLYNSAG